MLHKLLSKLSMLLALIFFTVDLVVSALIFTVNYGWISITFSERFMELFYIPLMQVWRIIHFPFVGTIEEFFLLSIPTHGMGLSGLLSIITFYLICCVYASILGFFLGWAIKKVQVASS